MQLADVRRIDNEIDEWIENRRDEIVAKMQELIRIPSVLGEPAPGAPFGRESLRALEFVRDLCNDYGLPTKIVDGYAMHAEVGQGDRLIGVLSHVDVVPAGEDWTYDPFGAQLDDGKIYGRGAIDDKGPAIASLYALFVLKQLGVSLSSRIRAIIGADEETGFRCVKYYFTQEEMPDIGFTPDGSFPAIYAEKGIATPIIQSRIPDVSGPIKLVEMRAGVRSNMVPDRAFARLQGTDSALRDASDRIKGDGITVELDKESVVVRAVGVSAHASTPNEGVNAVGLLTRALIDSNILSSLNKWLDVLYYYATDTTGRPLGIAAVDEITGSLTSSLGIVATQDGKLSATFSVRYPVTWKGDAIQEKIGTQVAGQGFELIEFNDSPPLYVPEDDPLITTLVGVYRELTGDDTPIKTMGGGTYARALKKGVAFGASFPGFPDIAHKADEFWYVDDLILSTRIYARSLARLAASNEAN